MTAVLKKGFTWTAGLLCALCALFAVCTFTSPAYADDVSQRFKDVGANEWYTEHVQWCYDEELMTGYDNVRFGVGHDLTRAEFATILWRYAEPEEYVNYNEATAKNETSWPDVLDGAYYTQAANWSYTNGVFTGYNQGNGNYTFGSDDPITREQAITVLWRFVGEPNAPDTAVKTFPDVDTVSDWAYDGMVWACANELITGAQHADKTFWIEPLRSILREEMAKVLHLGIANGLIPILDTHAITITQTDGGTLTTSTKEAVQGRTITVTATHDKHYALDFISVVSASGLSIDVVGSGKTFTFTMPDEDVTIYATWKDAPQYNVNLKQYSGGTLSADVDKAEEDDVVTITATPDENFALNSIAVITTSGTELEITTTNNVCSFIMPAEEVTVYPAWAWIDDTYNQLFMLEQSIGGTLIITETNVYSPGSDKTIKFIAIPDEGYELSAITRKSTNVEYNTSSFSYIAFAGEERGAHSGFTYDGEDLWTTSIYSSNTNSVTKAFWKPVEENCEHEWIDCDYTEHRECHLTYNGCYYCDAWYLTSSATIKHLTDAQHGASWPNLYAYRFYQCSKCGAIKF